MARLEDVIDKADIIVTTTGNKDIVTRRADAADEAPGDRGQRRALRQRDRHGRAGPLPGIIKINIKPQVDEWVFPDGHSIIVLSEGRLMNLGNATGHPSFVMSNSFSNQVIAQVELFTKHEEYNNDVYRLPKVLDEKVAKIHVLALGGELTKLSKDQAEYIGVDVEGRSSRSTTATDRVRRAHGDGWARCARGHRHWGCLRRGGPAAVARRRGAPAAPRRVEPPRRHVGHPRRRAQQRRDRRARPPQREAAEEAGLPRPTPTASAASTSTTTAAGRTPRWSRTPPRGSRSPR